MKEEVYRKAEVLIEHITIATSEVQKLKTTSFNYFKGIQIGDGVFCTTNEELSKQIIDTIIAYKEKQIEQWKQEFEKL